VIDSKIAITTPETAERVGRKIPVHQISSSQLRDALDLWTRLKGERLFPSRETLKPRDMARYLRNVTLFAVSAANEDFEYKVMGDAVVQAWGRSFCGMKRCDLNRLQPGMGEVIWNVCHSIVRRRQPLVLRGRLWRDERNITQQESIFLPFGPDDLTVAFVLSVSSFERQPFLIDPDGT
jgi:hypothetical protein